tara:strand:- start:3694 stop:4524 length:831 start_codon:yes stop_codon:yes gene_type:complete
MPVPSSNFAERNFDNPYPAGGPGRHLKSRLSDGDILVAGTITEYVRPSLVKLYKNAGFDFIYIEYEHGFLNPSNLADTILSARDNGLPVVSKTPQLERQEVSKLLEAGVSGIQLPRTETHEQVEELLGYIKFPPKGTRAMAPGYGNSDYVQTSDLAEWMVEQDAESTLVVHIETRLGYENAESIISTPGVDMVYCGPGDFSIEMGRPGEFDHPDVVGPMEEIKDIALKYKLPFGTTASGGDGAKQWINKGAQFFLAVDELDFIRESASRYVSDYLL